MFIDQIATNMNQRKSMEIRTVITSIDYGRIMWATNTYIQQMRKKQKYMEKYNDRKSDINERNQTKCKTTSGKLKLNAI